jgi:hypothetical protein
MDLFDELAKAQCEDVHDGKFSDNCKQYLLYEWRGKQVDFLQLLAYVRRVYDDDPVQGVATASSSISASGAVPVAEQSTACTAAPAWPPSEAGMEGYGSLSAAKRGVQDSDEAIALSKERSSTRGT